MSHHSLQFPFREDKKRFAARVRRAARPFTALALAVLASCTALPSAEHYMLRTEYYRGLEEARRTSEAEKQAIRERLIGLQAELAREEGRRIQVEEEAERLRRDLARSEARIDSITAAALVESRAGRSELELALANIQRLEVELETVRAARDRIAAELDAMRAEEAARRETTTVVLDDLVFAAGSSRLVPSEARRLRARAAVMAAAEHISIIGYTDDREARNPVLLGAQRAAEVAAWIRSRLSVPADRITIVSRGAADPRIPNTTAESRARNRRVEIIAVDR